jgi:hypothetical protein
MATRPTPVVLGAGARRGGSHGEPAATPDVIARKNVEDLEAVRSEFAQIAESLRSSDRA